LARASQTCHYWHILAEDNLLWREKCREEGVTDTAVWGGRITRRRPQNRSVYTPSNASVKTAWKSVYKRQKMIENNWSRSPLQPPKVYLLTKLNYRPILYVMHGTFAQFREEPQILGYHLEIITLNVFK